MNHHLRTIIAIALTVVGMAVTSPYAKAQEFENQTQAVQYIREIRALYNGKADIMRPISNMRALMNREFGAYQEAINTSETMEEAKGKYQVNLQDFKDARAQFDDAIATAEAISANSQSPEIQALANQYAASLKSAQNRVNKIAVAFMYQDTKALLSDGTGLAQDVKAVSREWRAAMPTVKVKLKAAKAQLKRVYEPEVVDCPYESGTKAHVLHCILGQPMAEGTGN